MRIYFGTVPSKSRVLDFPLVTIRHPHRAQEGPKFMEPIARSAWPPGPASRLELAVCDVPLLPKKVLRPCSDTSVALFIQVHAVQAPPITKAAASLLVGFAEAHLL